MYLNTNLAPLALFLDEPTSGLDSTSALKVTTMLRSISRLGITVVAVMHQPRVEIFSKFDDVLMLAPGGKTAYFGAVKLVKPYFSGLGFRFPVFLNPADVLMDILFGRGRLAEEKEDGKQVKKNVEPKVSDDLVGLWERLGLELVDALARGEGKEGVANRVKVFEESAWTLSDEEHSSDHSPKPSLTTTTTITTKSPRSVGTSTDGLDPNAICAMEEIVARRGASFFKQIWLVHNRSLVQQARTSGSLASEVFVGFFAGLIMGVAGYAEETFHGVHLSPYRGLSSAPNEWLLGLCK